MPTECQYTEQIQPLHYKLRTQSSHRTGKSRIYFTLCNVDKNRLTFVKRYEPLEELAAKAGITCEK